MKCNSSFSISIDVNEQFGALFKSMQDLYSCIQMGMIFVIVQAIENDWKRERER